MARQAPDPEAAARGLQVSDARDIKEFAVVSHIDGENVTMNVVESESNPSFECFWASCQQAIKHCRHLASPDNYQSQLQVRRVHWYDNPIGIEDVDFTRGQGSGEGAMLGIKCSSAHRCTVVTLYLS